MPSSLWAALVPLVALSLWLLTRRRPQLLRSTDSSAVAALNRAQIAARLDGVPAPGDDPVGSGPSPPGPAGAGALAPLPPPRNADERRAYLGQIQAWWRGDARQRRLAVDAAARWRHPLLLPLLRQALRDVDLQVVAAAAAGIAPYRCRNGSAAAAGATPAKPWRRVSRTR